ncbi:MAG: hypothetical protein J2P59_01990, partial [Acidimicrobiales bacterium]|nr:hypothetical protein [Acidimicrobiales bacterium]
MGPATDGGPEKDGDDDEEQSALELVWALRTTPLTPQGRHPSGRRDPGQEELSPAARELKDEMDLRRRQLVELLAAHLRSGARTVPAILSRLSPEERTRMNEVLGGRTIAEVLGTTDLF